MGVCVATVLLSGKVIHAAVNQQNTGTEKVAVDKTVSIADTQEYKNMDYSFMKTFQYGSVVKASKEFDTVEDMKKASIKKGSYVRTKGYYADGDNGAACYLIAEKQETGGIKLENGLYANIQPDTYTDNNGEKWVVGNVLQYGAKADGKQEDEVAINNAIKSIGTFTNEKDSTGYECERGLIYMPAGEYKCANTIRLGYSNVNLVGDGADTVLFTDNDYRDKEGYAEFFFEVWGANHTFIANFQIEAREVDLYHYMRQFVVLYSEQVYLYQVNLLIPQSTYSSYYFEDKQYSNFCCYTGNKFVTVDGCKMEQMSGTYRGANVGVLDIWSGGEENITIMNCDFYGNARDEQFGFFSKDDENASVKHINFINNTIHSVQLKYPDIIGTRTMCFSVAYADSKNVENIRIAGNHFICETDSKFMTFGTVKNCVVENNIIEVKCTYQTWSMVFDSSNENAEDILIQKNQFFLTSDYGIGKGNLTGGNLTLKENRIFSDVELAFGILGPEIHGNEIIFLKNMSKLASNANCTDNKIYLYKGLGNIGTNKRQIVNYGGDNTASYNFSGNEIYDYERVDKLVVFQSLIMLDGDLKTLNVTNNKYYMPNSRFLSSEYSESIPYKDTKGTYYKNSIFRKKSGSYGKINVLNNTFQMVELEKSDSTFTYSGNQCLAPEADLTEQLCSTVKILKDGEEVTNITATEDSVDLSAETFVVVKQDSDGNVIEEKKVSGKKIRWYTSVEKIATVSTSGKVTRKLYGDVAVYAVPLDGSGVYGKCVLHFARQKADSIAFAQKKIELQSGLKYYMEYTVLPKGATQELIWTTSDKTVATVDQNGTITAISEGNATVEGTSVENPELKARINVKVSKVTVKKISLNETVLDVDYSKIGTTKRLKVSKYIPENATNQGIKQWKSSDEEVAKVDQNGVVTFVGGGKATISAYSMDMSCAGTCKIYVHLPAVSNLKVKEYTNDRVVLNWDETKKADGYYVYQWKQSTAEWVVLNDGNPVTETSFEIGNLTSNTDYTFSVRAYNAGWETGERVVYESQDKKVSVKTLAYTPVTKIWSSHENVGIPLNTTVTLTCTYSPNTANYNNLKASFAIKNKAIASIEEIKEVEKGKYSVTIKGLAYGTTVLTFAINDAWGLKKEIPIGVLAKQSLPEEYITVTGSAIKATIHFKGFDNEKDLLQEKAITGYMIRRTESIEFTDVKYIPADGSNEYLWEDTDVVQGKKYSYTVTPCLKAEDAYFLGYGNGYHGVTIPQSVEAEKLSMEKEIYVIPLGEKKKIHAKIEPAEAMIDSLNWRSENEGVATVIQLQKEQAVSGTDYATVTGCITGVTKIYAELKENSKLQTAATVIITPGKVKNVKKASDTDSVSLFWNAVDNADGYYVYRWNKSARSWELVGDVQENSFTDKKLESSKMYQYKVSAYYQYNASKYEGTVSEEVIATTEALLADDFKVKATGYEGVYDGKLHHAVQVTGTKEGDSISYSEDGKVWDRYVPTVKNVLDSKVIYVSITRDEKSYYMSVICRVSPKSMKDAQFRLEHTQYNWDGKEHRPKVVMDENIAPEEYQVTYQGECKNVGKGIVIVQGKENYKDSCILNYQIKLIQGKTYIHSGYKYKITSKTTVRMMGATNTRKTTILVPNVVNLGGTKLKVTEIGAAAFKKYKKLTSIKIGSNVTKIGAQAFAGDTKLKKCVFLNATIKTVGKNAWKGISKNASFFVPKKGIKCYQKKLTKKTGFTKKMKIKRN